MNIVYLCGPINGKTYEDSADGWRKTVSTLLESPQIEVFSPMRGKKHLKGKTLGSQGYELNPLTTAKGILGRDFNDVKRCDVLFVNFLDSNIVSIGSVAEIAWAYSMQKPIVVCMSVDNIHDHLFIKQMATYVVDNLLDAARITKSILLNEDI